MNAANGHESNQDPVLFFFFLGMSSTNTIYNLISIICLQLAKCAGISEILSGP